MPAPISATEAAPRVNWTALSEDSKATIRQVVLPIHLGYNLAEIADALGCATPQLSRRLTVLRREIREQLDEAP